MHNTAHPNWRLWIVDNGSTEPGMVDYLKSVKTSWPNRVHSLILHKKNIGIARVTNDFWKKSDAPIVGKIDNDTLVPYLWLTKLLEGIHKIGEPCILAGNHMTLTEMPKHGVELNNIQTINGQQYTPGRWVGGCCYIMQRRCLEIGGQIEEGIGKVFGWTRWQLRNNGKMKIGYIVPYLRVDHMDEKRHPLNMQHSIYNQYYNKIRGFRKNPSEDTNI